MLSILVVLLGIDTVPIIRRADRPDSAYRAMGEKYPAVGRFGRIGDGTLIAPRWVVTAAHVARAVQRRGAGFEIGGRTYVVRRVVLHPDWREMEAHDVGLVELGEAVTGVAPLALYRGANQRGQIAVLVGHGAAGTGDARARAEDGLVRGATSLTDSVDGSWLYFSFDAPPGGSELEGAPGPGDSGGPAIIMVGRAALVAGISSAGYDGAQGPGSYGAVDVFTRISTHAAWIDSVMGL